MGQKLLRYIRYAIQLLSLFFFVALYTYLIYPLEWQSTLLTLLSRLDPWGIFEYIRLQHSLPVWGFLPLLLLIITLLFGRVFCGWFCPFGALLMLVDKISSLLMKLKPFRRFSKLRVRFMQKLLPFRYFWLLFLGIIFILGSGLVYFLTPFAFFSHEVVRIYKAEIPWLLIGIVIITVLFSRLWCSVICPTGILLSFFGKLRIFRIQTNGKCVNCRKCSHVCPVGAAPTAEHTAGDGCLVCLECQSSCPMKTVKYLPWKRSQNKKEQISEAAVTKEKNLHTRRQFLKLTGAAVIATAVSFTGKVTYAAKKALRPPGALKEEAFISTCNRCGKCIKVCPNNALVPMSIMDGIETFDTPHIIARKASCSLCMACQEVCPTGAIAKVGLDRIQMGRAELDKSRCLAWHENKLCFICGEQCPVVAIQGDDKHRPSINPNVCVGCGSCERACPVDGAAAIRVIPK